MIRKFDIVSMEISRAITKSDHKGGFYPDKRDSKLCFEVLKTFSVPENNLPLTGEKRFRSQRFFYHSRISIGLQHQMFH